MKNKKTIVENLADVLKKENERLNKKGTSLSDVYDLFSKIGIETKATYSLPLKDTIGKTFNEQTKFRKQSE